MVVTLSGWKPCPNCAKNSTWCYPAFDDEYGSWHSGQGCGKSGRVFWYEKYDFRLLWLNLARWGMLYRAFIEGHSAGVTDARR